VLKETSNNPVFNGYSTQITRGYKSYIETSVRSFIKAYYSELESNRYGIPNDLFKTYKSIIEFIQCYEPAKCVKLTPSSISHLKNRNCISRTVPRTKENEDFIKYIKSKIPSFDDSLFFKEHSDEAMKRRKSM
jgi:hypothetical protein